MSRLHTIGTAIASAWALLAAAPALAAPGETAQVQGQAAAEVVLPLRVQPLQNLRFGAFMRPTAAGRITITPLSVVTSTIDISTFPGNRGAARFRVDGQGSRFFIISLPTQATISNGTATMRVDQFTAGTPTGVVGRFDSTGFFDLQIGGRLNVNANQAPGNYSGTFTFTILYL